MAEVASYEWMPYEGPKDGIAYPVNVSYCGECTLPVEYCEFSGNPDKCRLWMEKYLPDLFEQLMSGDSQDNGDDGKKRQTRGGKAQVKKKKTVEHKIVVSRASRGKKKFVTVITGLSTYNIDLKVASKFFGQKFATGSSVTGNSDEIVIQGDVKDDLIDILSEKWPEIEEDSIDDIGDVKRA